jgi:putative FmdB family regulatory protein
MPLYEYHCSKCDKNFDVLEKFSDEPLKKHKGCGGKVARVLAAPAFQLKGSGWYVTDYGKGGSKTAPPSEGSAKSEGASSESKSESKSETKSASTSEAKSESKSESKTKSKSSSKSE